MKHGPDILEYSEIVNGIFIGTNQCCQIDFDKRLLSRGITADISLEKTRLDAPFGIEYYLWIPVADHFLPSQKQFDVGVEFLKDMVARKVKIYVHCEHGHGRAPALVAAYLVLRGMSSREALAFIKKRRPAIHPNKRQIAGVSWFEKRWKKGRKYAIKACA